MNDFNFRGTFAELRRRYPSDEFEIHDINGLLPNYRRSYHAPMTRSVRLRTRHGATDFNTLASMLHTNPEMFDVIEIMLI